MRAVRAFALLTTSILVAAFGGVFPASAEPNGSTPSSTGSEPPTDPVKLAAYKVLDTHCSRCHQSDRLVGRKKVAKGFGNILKLDQVGANPKYVKRGDPDHSLLYHVIVRQEMPSDVFQDGDLDHPIPTADDLKTLRTWIVALAHENESTLVARRDAPNPNDWQALQAPNAKAPSPTADAVALSTAATSPTLVPKSGEPAGSTPVQVASLPHPGEPVPIGRDDLGQTPDAGAKRGSVASRDLVYEAQDRLQKLGCYSGRASGVLDSETDSALSRYNAKLGRGTTVAAVTPELLEELRSLSGRVCAPVCPRGRVAAGMQCIPAPAADDAIDSQKAEQPKRVRPPVVAAPVKPVNAAPIKRQEAAPQIRRIRPPAPAPSVAVAHAPPPARRVVQAAPPRKVAHAVPLRQPAFRQAARPSFREAPSESSAASTVSGINGI